MLCQATSKLIRQFNIREYRRGNQKKTIPRNWSTQDEDKHKHNTICVGHHYIQTNTNNVNKT
jgi:hypothetical protein